MNKKAITMQTIVIAILALMVLFILLSIFQSQMSGLSGKYTRLTNEPEESARENICGGLFSYDTKCVKGDDCGAGWIDGPADLKCRPATLKCCQRAK